VEFATDWSDPCLCMDLILNQLKSRLTENTKLYKIDADNNRELLRMYNVREVPSLLIFKKGKVASSIKGLYWPKIVRKNIIKSLQKAKLLKKQNVLLTMSNFAATLLMPILCNLYNIR
ncbi:MAG: thioredoxin family protein, partial [Bacteroidales bacterium]|nr:thioredoxin family protein [Bacteroidales bacterium]